MPTTSGLAIAEDFFRQWALPFIDSRWPDLAERVAAGRIFGSDVLGNDDARSRGHNWGPQFHIWLTASDYENMGTELNEFLNENAPNPWNGYELAGGGDQAVHVHNIEAYCNEIFHGLCPDFRSPPWGHMKTYESHLYYIRHGAIWHDPSNVFGELQTALHFYPKRWHLERLREECFRVWHHGEYNFVQRMAKRGDKVACAICLGEFISGVMRLCLLANRDYAPYWKWLAAEFRKRDEFRDVADLLARLVDYTDFSMQSNIVLEISEIMHSMLVKKGYVGKMTPNKSVTPLFNDHNEIQMNLTECMNSVN